ncbi:MAG: XRE family transcriptional regulator [Clostridia bacterium BRH_c25]|nr:MAG: XRE family transcriptional regulator [Clostridia bacterium BRH_c25]
MKVLIVDDEPAIVDLIKINLEMEGFDTCVCYTGQQALAAAPIFVPDLILLDIMLPDINGFEVCKNLQKLNTPIIMLTAKNDIKDKLYGLELGADDYITKPFDSRELTARIKTVLKRIDKSGTKEDTSIQLGPILINTLERQVYLDGEEMLLTPKEYDLLMILCENQRKVFSRENLLEMVWKFEYIGDSRTVDMHVQRLRKKLGKYSFFIKTVFGIGYKFEVQV